MRASKKDRSITMIFRVYTTCIRLGMSCMSKKKKSQSNLAHDLSIYNALNQSNQKIKETTIQSMNRISYTYIHAIY